MVAAVAVVNPSNCTSCSRLSSVLALSSTMSAWAISESSYRCRRGKDDFDARPVGDVRRALEPAAMRLDNRTGHVQAYPSLPRFVHEMWSPQLAIQLRWEGASVGNANGDTNGVAGHGDHQPPLIRHRLQCIDDHVHDRALYLILDTTDFLRSTVQLEDDLDALANRPACNQAPEAFAHYPDVEGRTEIAGTRTKHRLDGPIQTFHFSRYRIQTFCDGGICRGRFPLKQAPEQGVVDPDDVQHAFEIMCPVTSQKRERPVTRRLLEKLPRSARRSTVA